MSATERLVPWVLRALWLVSGLVGSIALDGALDGRDDDAALVVRIVLGAGWVAGVVAMAVPAVRSLTAARVVVPLAVPFAVAVWIGGGDVVASIVTLAAAVLATAVAGSAELGRAFVQASAYGSEDRHVLRPPAAYLAAAIVSWLLMATGLTVGTVVLAHGRWVLGSASAIVGAAIGGWSLPRWHRLSRRWLVVVPAGLVVHDHLVLAETLMLRRVEIAGVTLAPAGTDAADLTGPAGGHALEIVTTGPVTAVFRGTPDQPGGTAIHLTACLVAPTRPGRALAALTRR